MTKCYISLTFILVLTSIVSSKNFDCRSLQWVPVYRKKVFTAFINNLNCPSWTTRNSFSKDPTKYTTLRLPEGKPFAFNCGACFSPGPSKVNITAEMYPDSPLILKPIPKKNNNKKENLLHARDDYTVCLVSYGITRPIVKGGTITCRFNRGTMVYKEKITFSVQKGITEEVGEEEEIEVPINGVVRLQCPKHESIVSPMHIWYTPDPSTEDKVPFVSPTLDPEIIYRPKKKEEKIFCAVYNLINPTIVRITRYKLLLRENHIKPSKWVVEEPENEESQLQNTSSNIVLIVVGILVVGGCTALILVAASYGVCRRRRQNNNNKKQTKEFNRLSLIPSPASPYDGKRLQNVYSHQ